MLQPQPQWYWYLNSEGQLSVCLKDELQFVTPYANKQLLNLPSKATGFNLEDHEIFIRIQEECAELLQSCSKGLQLQVLLNATAALRFHKPIAMKSWLFRIQPMASQTLPSGIQWISTQMEQAMVMVLEVSGSAATCMVLADNLALDNGKSLKQFELVRVSHDRLMSWQESQLEKKRA